MIFLIMLHISFVIMIHIKNNKCGLEFIDISVYNYDWNDPHPVKYPMADHVFYDVKLQYCSQEPQLF